MAQVEPMDPSWTDPGAALPRDRTPALAAASAPRPKATAADRMRSQRVLMQAAAAERMEVPDLRVVVNEAMPNAFAVVLHGTPHVIVTTALLRLLDDRELQAVLQHELGHVQAHHSERMVQWARAALAVKGISGYYAYRAMRRGHVDPAKLGLSLAASIALRLLTARAARGFELEADAHSDPEALISALRKIAGPNPHRRSTLERLLADHPSLDDRVAQLRPTTVPAAALVDVRPVVARRASGPASRRGWQAALV